VSNIPEREFDYADADFARVKAIIYRKAGINLSDSKKQLVYSRLARRLRVLQLNISPTSITIKVNSKNLLTR
jgi:chemotaxis protein methyltransferase CheR